MMKLEVAGSKIDPFTVYYWDFEQIDFGDGEHAVASFKLIGPPTDLEEDDEVTVTVIADGIMEEYTCEVAVVSENTLHEDKERLILTSELMEIPES